MRISKRFLIAAVIIVFAAAISFKIFLDSIYRLPVLMYHSIDYTSDRKDRMTVPPDVFAKQMKYLSDKRYNVIPLEKAVEYIEREERPPRNTVAITIDDGYANNYTYVYPVLKRYHIPATIFIIVNMVGEEGFLNWDKIKEMSDSGIIDIESHTMSHTWLTGLDDARLRSELMDSKRILEGGVGKEIKYLCYPMGAYNEHVKSAVKAAGYKAAFATKPTRLSPNYDICEIKRVRISPAANNLFVFVIKISDYHSFLRVIQNDYKDIPYLLWKRKSL
ncbi:MAG: polysaccharide deacetylase family protein [Candidatus Omnitrophica bacterium]|nr:polysaccharide deacetylase family protein [Candidatus Omnitrophota bacterium]